MAQHIGIIKQNEQNEVLTRSEANFAPVYNALAQIGDASQYPILSTVDPYGDTVFNHLQVPQLAAELERLKSESPSQQVGKTIEDILTFLSGWKRREYLRLVGD